MNSKVDTEVQAYLTRLRRELAGLPAAEIEEIVQDLEPQLAAMADDLGEEPSPATLADRLGAPAEYARELRTAMGEPVGVTPWQPSARARVAMWVLAVTTVVGACAGHLTGLVMSNAPRPALLLFGGMLVVSLLVTGGRHSTVDDIGTLPEVRLAASWLRGTEHRRRFAGYLTTLRPAWLRAKPALAGLGAFWLSEWFGWYQPMPALLACAVAALTVAIGHSARTDRRWLWLSLPLSGWAVGVAVKVTELLPTVLAGDHYWP